MKIKFTIFLCLVLLTLDSCQKKDLTSPLVIGSDNNPNALVITWQWHGFVSAVFYLNSANSTGYYDTTLTPHQTLIFANEDTDSLHLQLLIRFNGEAAFSSIDTVPKLIGATDSIMITNKNSQKTTYYSPVLINNYLDITSYDDVGGHIKGIIFGAFINTSNKQDTLKISNGRFSVLRLPDR